MSTPPARSGALSTRRFLGLMVAVVALLVAARWSVTPDPTKRNFEYFPNMSTSPALESQSVASLLPGGFAQQPLVAGVVARGRMPFRYGAEEEDAKRAGRELVSPIAADDAAALEQGAEVYRIHCTPCHGADGTGLGPAVLRGMLQPPAMRGENAMQMRDGEIYHLLTLGRGNMPSMRARLDPDDRWSAILQVRQLQQPPPEPPPEEPPPEEEPK